MARSTYEDFIMKEKIGSGSYGVVFKVLRKVDKQVYAMKEIDLQGMSRKVRAAGCMDAWAPQQRSRRARPPR
jgi:serine/threonine protein kinase